MATRKSVAPSERYIAEIDEETHHTRSISQVGVFWQRLRRNPQARWGTVLFLAIVMMAIFAPLITPGVTTATSFTVEEGYSFGVFGPTLAHFPARLFGTTAPSLAQTSVLAQVTFGARPTVIISVVSALIALLVGVLIGIISGYYGGWIDAAFMRFTDLIALIPPFPLIILLITNIVNDGSHTHFETSIPVFVLILSFAGWTSIARLVRAHMLVLRQQEYIEAAHAAGIASPRIIVKHLLPNALPPAIVATILNVGKFIVLEATLDFLGVGVTSTVTWGNTLSLAQGTITAGNWWWVVFPGLFMALTVFAMNLIGEGIRDILDVRGYTR